jgi:hypothetical protein
MVSHGSEGQGGRGAQAAQMQRVPGAHEQSGLSAAERSAHSNFKLVAHGSGGVLDGLAPRLLHRHFFLFLR